MKRIASCLNVFLAMFLLAPPALSSAATIRGSVSDERGLPIASASVTINGGAISVGSSGSFSATVSDQDIYTIRIAAPGHYAFLQTFSRADLQLSNSAGLDVPAMALVARKKGRRLLVFGGDTMMGRRFLEPRSGEPVLVRADSAEADMRAILQHMKPYLQLADFASVNLETQLSATAMTESLPKSVAFFTDTAIAPALRWAGVDYVALGNNHTFDYLDVGLQRTLAALQATGMAYSGAGANDRLARQPHVAEVGGSPLYLHSYVGWPGNFEPNQVASATKGGAALGTADSIAADMRSVPGNALSIMQYHSGLEYVSKAPLAEETQLKLAVDNGADLAIGHHSHVIQGYEVYKGRLLAYSLGNFVFDQYLPSTQAGMLLFVWYDDDRFYRAEVVPMHVNGYVPTPATGTIRYDILQRLARLSDSDTTCVGSSGGHLTVMACGGGVDRLAPQHLDVGSDETATGIYRLSSLNALPVPEIASVTGPGSYRLGIDLLRRGDFEYSGLFATTDRTWTEHTGVSVIGTDSKKMQIRLADDATVTTGMKVFTRVFSRSNPATVVASFKSDGCARFRFSLQRRPDGVGFADALATGPVSVIGEIETGAGITQAELDFQLPRTFTRSIRLLVEATRCGETATPVIVEMDDLAIIEWQTPWLGSGSANPEAAETQASHVQFQGP